MNWIDIEVPIALKNPATGVYEEGHKATFNINKIEAFYANPVNNKISVIVCGNNSYNVYVSYADLKDIIILRLIPKF